jgi:hypothetical protein
MRDRIENIVFKQGFDYAIRRLAAFADSFGYFKLAVDLKRAANDFETMQRIGYVSNKTDEGTAKNAG